MHRCSALVVACMDFRFQTCLRQFLNAQGLNHNYDLLAIAGTQKNFVDDETSSLAMHHVELAVNLHGVKEVHIFAHMDCGAYGGSQAFENRAHEVRVYHDDLIQARCKILGKFPKLKVMLYLIRPDALNQPHVMPVD